MDELVSSSSSSSEGQQQFSYFSDGVGILRNLSRDLNPWGNFLVSGPATTLTQCDSSLWVGAAGVTAHWHYDSYHNLYVQAVGTKRFLLVSPEQAPGMLLHPSLHSKFRQSQHLPEQDTPRGVQPVEAILQPGEVLYMPPYWFHRVTAQTISFSVNTWCPAAEYHLFKQILNLPVPFDGTWTNAEFYCGFSLFAQRLLEAVGMDITEVFEDLQTRYVSLYGEQQQGTAGALCACQNSGNTVLSIVQTYLAESTAPQQLINVFLQMRPAVRRMYLQDYLEEIAYFVYGADRVVVAFAANQQC
jgi:hypothetical protein